MTECVCVCWADLCCLHTFSHLPWNAGGENTTGWTLVSKRKKVKSVRGCWWWWVAPNSSLQFVWIFRLHNFFVLRSSIPSRSVKYHDNKWSAVSPRLFYRGVAWTNFSICLAFFSAGSLSLPVHRQKTDRLHRQCSVSALSENCTDKLCSDECGELCHSSYK